MQTNTTRPVRLSIFVSILLMTAACSESAYDEAWGTDEIPSGKADGVLDSAPVLDFGEIGRGYVEGDQLDMFAIDLREGDVITTTLDVVNGDLAPHFTLYFGGNRYIASDKFERSDSSIEKSYTLAATGRYYLAVKPYRGAGAGRYAIRAECSGGPCNGEVLERYLTVGEQATCIESARVCSFAELPQWRGAVGASRARSIFEACLEEVTIEGASCTDACEGDAEDFCGDVISALPFYADANRACLSTLDECLDACRDAGANAEEAEEVWTSPESMCWSTGYNSNCDSYARSHSSCGGENQADSNAACHALCEATDGAWMDDLDTICTEACDE
ncbi:MAG: hypothetical protein IPK60_05670 [Sandaracinaceae bacterium]|jgi:hypothetical protein|nr:hypothetical protein [Sandaracinaceae bacterium]